MVKTIIHRPLWHVILLLFFAVYIVLWIVIAVFWGFLLLLKINISPINVFYFQMSLYPIIISLLFRYLWNRFVSVKPSASWEYNWDDGPWINWVDDPKTTMVINWITKDYSETELLYGLDETNLKSVRSEAGKIHRIYLENLKSNTKYYYKLLNFSKDQEIHEFLTAPDDYKPFKFIVLGDSQNGGGYGDENWGYPKIVEAINQKKFDLFFHTGDFSDQGNDIKSWHSALKESSKIASDHPMHITVGNHDTGTHYLHDNSIKKYPDEGANFDYLLGYRYERSNKESRITPFQSRYYSFDYSNCRMVFIDTQNQKMAEPKSNQWDYLRNKLKSTPNGMWKIVFQHWPIFERKIDQDTGKSSLKLTKYGKYLFPLYEECGVDIIFTGHNHIFSIISKKYENSDKIIHQIVSGGAGNTLRKNDSFKGEEIGLDELLFYENSTHYLDVEVKDDEITISAFYPDNKLIGNKEFIIKKNNL